MATGNTWLTGLMTAVIVFSLVASARAQTIIEGQTAFDNLRTIGARAPGNMVSAGVARALAAADAARAGVEITETSRPTSPRAHFLVEALEAVFDQLNQAMMFFQNLLFARAGLPQIDLTDILSPTTGTDGTDDADVAPPGEGDLGDVPDRSGGGRPGSK